MKKALITGVTGQDGFYLSKLLLDKGYEVHGLVRRSSSMDNRKHIDELNLKLHYGDMTDAHSLDHIIGNNEFDEIYNLAAMSHVGVSFVVPMNVFEVNTFGVINLLESCRKFSNAKIYQASTSEMLARPNADHYGIIEGSNENTPFEVHSPYAVSKLAAHNICNIYRKSYGMHISCGILFNHESPIRGENFVTRKITLGLNRMREGLIDSFELGNVSAVRDWGFAGDYVEAMWLMLQRISPKDYVISTGLSHSVEEFILEACKQMNLQAVFAVDSFVIADQDREFVGFIRVSDSQKRPLDVDYLKGDSSLARKELGWEPKTPFKQLIRMMLDHDSLQAKQEKERLI